MRTLFLAGGTVGAAGLKGRCPTWLVTVLEVSLVLALLLTGD